MKRFLLFISLLTIFVYDVSGQSLKDNCREADLIKNDTSYFYGESGSCNSASMANEKAMENMMNDIIGNNTLNIIYFTNSDDNMDQVERMYSTFKKLIIGGSKSLILSQKPNFVMARYIKKDVFRDYCHKREMSMRFYLNEGNKAEQQNRIGDALRYYYWSMMLCHAHPNGAGLLLEDPDDIDVVVPAYKWLTTRVDMILNDIRVITKPFKKNAKGYDVELSITTKSGILVNGLKYTYSDGESFDIINTVNDGVSLVNIKSKDMDFFDMLIDLENKGEAEHFDRDVWNVMEELQNQIHFNSANKVVTLKKTKDQTPVTVDTSRNELVAETIELLENHAENNNNVYLEAMKIIEKAIRNKDLDDAGHLFSEDAFSMFKNLANYGNMSIISKPEYKFVDFKGEVICRSIPLQFNYINNAGFQRNLVFRFNKITNLVTSIAFRLDKYAEEDILGKGNWNDKSRLTLINFLEDYQTAYAMKRLEYLEQIFSDDALIIVGHIVNKKPRSSDDYQLPQDKVILIRQTKTEYMNRLRRVFDSNEYINLRFGETDFVQSNNGEEIYGVRLKQEYRSSSYGDDGFLFLLVDLRDTIPVIHVRAWQPDKTPTNDLVDIDEFRL